MSSHFLNCTCVLCEVSNHLSPSGPCLSLDTLSLRRQDPLLCVSVRSLGSYVTADRSSFKTSTAAAQAC